MNKPVIYDVYSGAGGASRGYQEAGFWVLGVDNQPQPRYAGDAFVQMDAFEFFDAVERGEYPRPDAWHASPPCQHYTALKSMWNAGEHPDLIAATRERLEATGRPYVIENVVQAPLRNWVQLCGSSFGLGVRRHRRFEGNTWPLFLNAALPCCNHAAQPFPIDVTGTGGRGGKPRTGGGLHRKPGSLAEAREAMGIDWMTRRELSEAIPPAYSKFIGTRIREVLAP